MKPSLLINIRGRLLDLGREPIVMGILNHTPDSFFSGSRIQGDRAIHDRIEQILREGGSMVDVGGYSTRPDATEVSPEEEWARVAQVLEILKRDYPEVIVSVDTFRADVARKAVEIGGADLINDVSGGLLDSEMYATVGSLQVPYILMHMRGTPKTMQTLTEYSGKVTDVVISELLRPIEKARAAGIKDIILDPGFGFSKTLDQNYELMSELDKFATLRLPLLVGISRKSMIYRLFETSPQEALNGTSILNTFALLHGAHILRVHDVKEAVEAVKIVAKLKPSAD
ncbi:dihydropteroate synthase [Porphyromonas cangingivalis]|uniref:dihydropteroate synthase n=1 Tax=Porphyromonas cangingivalis TaxID=36874 RepID=A0A0A2EV49_PORCN|nr:dihydropteroate synthase [Porphyromonas cangingivalis]KGN80194.1 dihydropteroate synthase [Porphyromonas cangingivalis]